ncbi:GMC family oxidoreductase [Roseovarius sp. 2305UL8-3]|uniref:GMC family oxidoreductase n=1 Tax=Roseovarius conchicola TaxID=3121636 RepID=UPI0035271A11
MGAAAYDYIIVGGGTAGCVLAARLTEDSKTTVLMLEDGPDARPMLMNMPAGLGPLYQKGQYHWPYRSEPEPFAADKTQPYKMGRVLGGSSSINGLVWVRGHPQDYNDWADSGATEWDWASVEPYFRRIESFEDADDPRMGHAGPIPVTRGRPEKQVLSRAFLESAQEAGETINPNYNSGNQDGFCVLHQNTRSGVRGDVRRGYLDPVRKRKNLVVLTGHTVQRLRFDGKICTGVDVRRRGGVSQFSARREVLLCAGSVASPQLLELSGIGNPDVLREVGITLRHALPGVGENFHTHPTIAMTFKCTGPYSILSATRGPGKIVAGSKWLFSRTGAAATNHFEAGAFLRAFKDSDRPDYQLTFLPLALTGTTGAEDVHGYQVYVELISCKSRGQSHIVSDDISVQPRFVFNFLQEDRDVAVYRASVAMIRKIVSQPALAKLTKGELVPGAEVTDPAALDNWIRKCAGLSHHLVGTCRMGAIDDPGAVVDPFLRVRGIEGLRVIDASVMPTVTTGNTHAATIVIAEKGADMVRDFVTKQSKGNFHEMSA